MTAEEHYWRIHDEIKDLHKRKGADYGVTDDPFANLRAAEDFGFPAWVGVALRMRDKMTRIQAFVRSGELKNESVEDSLLDMANYAMLGLALYREAKEERGPDVVPFRDNSIASPWSEDPLGRNYNDAVSLTTVSPREENDG